MGRKEKKVYMHRQIMDLPVKKVIDHINRDKLDNRRHNLRVCLQRQNCKNHIRHKNNKSGFKGVSLDKRSNKWVVEIMTNGKRYRKNGHFVSKLEAAKKYNELAIRFHGKFALLNVI